MLPVEASFYDRRIIVDKQYCKTCEGTGEEQVPLSSVRHFAGKHRLAPTGRRPCTTCGGTGKAKPEAGGDRHE